MKVIGTCSICGGMVAVPLLPKRMSTYCHQCGAEYGHSPMCPTMGSVGFGGAATSPESTKPLWQMDIRHRLKLEPNRTDAVARLLFHDLYCARDEQMFVELVEQSISELQKALNKLRGC